MDPVATQILAEATTPEDKKAVLKSLSALLNTMDLEAAELEANKDRVASYEDQMASLEAQRSEVSLFANTQRTSRETVSRYLVRTFGKLIEMGDDSLTERNDRILGLYRSAAASIMGRDAWTEEAPDTSGWAQSFNRIVDRQIREVRRTVRGYSKVSQIHYLKHIKVPEELYRAKGYTNAPKEYWLQYASFNLIGSVLASNKFTKQLREEMAPSFEILSTVNGK